MERKKLCRAVINDLKNTCNNPARKQYNWRCRFHMNYNPNDYFKVIGEDGKEGYVKKPVKKPVLLDPVLLDPVLLDPVLLIHSWV
jgi:hypothetical protein